MLENWIHIFIYLFIYHKQQKLYKNISHLCDVTLVGTWPCRNDDIIYIYIYKYFQTSIHPISTPWTGRQSILNDSHPSLSCFAEALELTDYPGFLSTHSSKRSQFKITCALSPFLCWPELFFTNHFMADMIWSHLLTLFRHNTHLGNRDLAVLLLPSVSSVVEIQSPTSVTL